MQGGDDAGSERLDADIAEDGDDHEQERVDGGEAVLSERDNEEISFIVTELANDRIRDREKSVALLPMIDGS